MGAYQRILLTGGTGFVGSYLAPLLTQAFPAAERCGLTLTGDSVTLGAAWTQRAADLRDAQGVEGVVAAFQPDLVVHLAGQASIGRALGAAADTWRDNLVGALHLASALARHAPAATVLFASSASVYGASLNGGIVDETAPLQPLDAYGRSKAAAEALLADVLAPQSRLIIVRPVNHSGPRQNSTQFALASFAAQIAAIEAGRRPKLLRVGDLSKARDFLDVRDVVAAYGGLIARAAELPDRISVFNVASGQPHSIRELIEELGRLAKTSFDIEVDPQLLRPNANDIPSIACDATKLRQAVGWRPQYSIQELLQSLLDYWRGVEADDAPAAARGAPNPR